MGWCRRPQAFELVLSAWLAAWSAACEKVANPHELALRVAFACDADRSDSEQLRLRVVAGSCADDTSALYEATLRRGEVPPPIAQLSPGAYAVEAAAYHAEEQLVVRTCVEVSLPRAEPIEVILRSGRCAEPLDASEEEASAPDPAEDGGTDAGSQPCGDCSDSDPCTDDRCSAGACTHVPFDGARECDGVACTQGDLCAAGECKPGKPSDAACADDGNPCTAEICVAGMGCNRSSAAANGQLCDDHIGCTNTDQCRDGFCSGTDTCSAGQVCSAAARMCVSCANARDCDDGNPCTDDTCSAGKCGHSDNHASCDDGKGCTNNDVCTGGKCAGTSTCPNGGACGGSLCSCTGADQTLCTDRCVNLTMAASDCGLCGRACASGDSCQNGACKPSAATACTAYRSGGHDYLVCSDMLSWTAARDRCRGYGLVLAIVDSQSENDFLRDRLASAPHWIGASDRGAEGFNCRLSAEEGTWYWANANSDNGVKLCTTTAVGNLACTLESGRYQNWFAGQPNNIYCDCTLSGCSEGQDCATMDGLGDWYDDQCSLAQGYICETP